MGKNERQAHAQETWDGLSTLEKEEFASVLFGNEVSNIPAEQNLLGAILMNNEAFNLVPNFFKAEHFSDGIHQIIYQDIEQLVRQGKTANPATMSAAYAARDELSDVGGSEYLAKLAISAVAVINIKEYAKMLYDLHQRRKLHRILCDLRKKLVDPGKILEDVSELKYEFMHELMGLDDSTDAKRITHLSEVDDMVVSDVDKKFVADPTGLRCLDEILEGGFIRRKVYAFSAAPKRGKTMLMTTIFSNMVEHFQSRHDYETQHRKATGNTNPLQRTQVLYICAEMGQTEINHRIMGRRTGYNSSSFYTKQEDAAFVGKILDYQRDNQGCVGLMYDARGLRFDELQHALIVAKRRHNIAGFFLDYFGLVRPSPGARYRSPVEFQEELADWLSCFCKDNDIWCCTAQQINRDGKVRGGDALPMYVDAHLELDRSEKNNAAWIVNRAIRYTDRRSAGSRDNPSLFMRKEGPHFVDYDERDDAYVQQSYYEQDMEAMNF